VRSITQDDAHVFCRVDQIHDEALAMYRIIEAFYSAFQMPLSVRLSVRDPKHPEQFLGDEAGWQRAESDLRSLMEEVGKQVTIGEGEAAFYGPKLDFIATDAIGRQWQLATIQLDFVQPERFGLSYTNADGVAARPVMIHRAILGSYERFTAFLIEQTAGNFPVWLAPEQVRVLAVSEQFNDAALELSATLREKGFRVETDISNESVGKKIRNASVMKVPVKLLIGQKELDNRADGEWHLLPNWRADITDVPTDAITLDELVEVLNERAARHA
jgi:threonyl-tRNA synthetase